MKQTSNYQLNQWEKTDRILMEDFNGDNAKVDAALKALDTNVNAAAVALTKCGNCQIYTTSYSGNGKYGSNNALSLTFPHKPMLVAIIEQGVGTLMEALQGMTVTYARASGSGFVTVSWAENTMSWYADAASTHMNQSNHSYIVVALLAADA